jgi:peptidoglycan/LPS O-acetylase OafA/YrhL
MKRLLWLDVAKGLAILWVVYFHFFRTYFEHGSLPPADWSNLATGDEKRQTSDLFDIIIKTEDAKRPRS